MRDYGRCYIAFFVLLIVSILRFFDMSIVFHSMPMGIMQDYNFAKLMTAVYYASFMLFAYFVLKRADFQSIIRPAGYMLIFAAVFLFPMYLYSDYFGAADIYAWSICFVIMLLIILDRAIFLIPIGMAVMTMISPLSIISVELLIFVILFHRFVDSGRAMYIIVAALGLVLAVLGVLISAFFGVFAIDVQQSLSFSRFIIALILIIPYICLFLFFMKRLLSASTSRIRIVHIFTVLVGLIAPIFYIIIGDYSRAFFFAFMYYILIIMMRLIMGDEAYTGALRQTYSMATHYVTFPAILIAYPFVIMTMWISGPVTIFEETFVGL